MPQRLSKIKPIVLDLLRKQPELRDSDNLLVATIWNKLTPNVVTKIRILQLLAEGELPSPQSIGRVRRRIEQDYPELRGLTYTYRHKIAEPEVREELRTL